jgi:hypothetical protein
MTGQEQLTHSAPVGKEIFEVVSVFRTKASFDDCDWNGHLSNSSYAKVSPNLSVSKFSSQPLIYRLLTPPQNADYARMKAISRFWFPFIMDGGWMALGGGYYNYVREIPVGADYEIWLSVGGWDEKWVRPLLSEAVYCGSTVDGPRLIV